MVFADGTRPVVLEADGTRLQGLTIRDCGVSGITILARTAHVEDVSVTGCVTGVSQLRDDWGVERADITLVGVRLQENPGRGAFFEQADVTMTDVRISDNGGLESGGQGAGVRVESSTVVATDVVIADNQARLGEYGGGLLLQGSDWTGGVIERNRGPLLGGGIANTQTSTLSEVVVRNNVSGDGAGIGMLTGRLTLNDVTVRDNSADGLVGGATGIDVGRGVATLNGGAVYRNEYGGISVEERGELYVNGVDFGEGVSDNNGEYDVRTHLEELDRLGAGETFACLEGRCE